LGGDSVVTKLKVIISFVLIPCSMQYAEESGVDN
jgi:hypothetical protein